MTLTFLDIFKIVVVLISAADFIIYAMLFLSYMIYVPFKTIELSKKIISIGIMFFLIIFKICYIPIFVSPMKSVIKYDIPGGEIIITILTYLNVSFSIIPLFLSTYTLFLKHFELYNNGIQTYERDKIINIIMPIYNEKPQSLLNAIESVKKLHYPKELIHLYLSFDEGVFENGHNSSAFLTILSEFGFLESDTRERIDCVVDGLQISICRFKHGGKKSAQYGAFKEMELDNRELQNSLIFFIDSDIILKSDSLDEFTKYMKYYDKSALTGMITCVTKNQKSFLSYYQDSEYISGQIFWRNLESYCGSTICLPGAFTIMKYSFIKKVSDVYFFDGNKYTDNSDYQRFYLGEDRYLTHLLMEVESWQLGFCESACCKTYAPDGILELLKQRKRWYLGHLSNDVWMLCSINLWKMYPLLSLFNLFNNIRNVSIYIYLLYFAFLLNMVGTSVIHWFIFIILPTALNFIFIVLYTLKINRKMNIPFYLLFIIFQPIINMVYMYYTIFHINENSWGGVRTVQDKPTIETIQENSL